jgi:glucose/arabinose dehydrogenase
MRDGKASGSYEVFADGFAGKTVLKTREEAAARPMGLAEGPDGSLYIVDSVKGKIWRVINQRGGVS